MDEFDALDRRTPEAHVCQLRLVSFLNYYLWGPGDSSWEVMIVITWYKGHYDTIFSDIQQVDSILTEASGPGINGMPVYICRKPGLPIKDIWAYLKTYQ